MIYQLIRIGVKTAYNWLHIIIPEGSSNGTGISACKGICNSPYKLGQIDYS